MPKKLVLLADDSGAIRKMVGLMLERANFDVADAADGEEALQKAMKAPPEVILLDINMPKMDGIEACRRMRQVKTLEHIPIVMITTSGESSYVHRAQAAGCTSFLIKPFKETELRATLSRYFKDLPPLK